MGGGATIQSQGPHRIVGGGGHVTYIIDPPPYLENSRAMGQKPIDALLF